jgi:hypothetical protein
MNWQTHRFYIWFIDLFPTIILQNKLISKIINITGIKLALKKDEIDSVLNTDI